jgi:hypothetical protein
MRSILAALLFSFASGAWTFAQVRSAPVRSAPADPPVEALVTRVSGTVWFRTDPASPKERLTTRNAPGKELRAGNELKAESGGEVIIQIFGEKKQIVITDGMGWYPIPNRRLIITAQPARSNFKNQFQAGGRPRGSSQIILSPQRHGVIRPSTLVFRWRPLKESPVTLSFKLARDNKTLWSQANIDGMSGQLTSELARKSLRKIQKRSVSRYIEFTLAPTVGKTQRTLFRVMSVNEEELLAKELSTWDGNVEFTRIIGRAWVFSRYRLYDEAAAEYESALIDSPESADLLETTIRAYCRAGNRIRAEELAKRLPTGHLLSNDCTLLRLNSAVRN